MSFAMPWMLAAAAGVPLVLWALLRVRRAARRARVVAALGPRAVDAGDQRLRRRRDAVFVAAVALLCVALAQPRWGTRVRTVTQQAVDLVVCLDVSNSMLARDVVPSRLEAAQRGIRALAARAGGERLGLVAFAGEARLVVPLTQDLDTYADLASVTDPLAVVRGGTDIGAALEAALAALGDRDDDYGHAAIVVVTDGEDHSGAGRRVAEELCAPRGIAVHCVGYGTELGSKIVLPAVRDGAESYLRSSSGDEVVTVMDRASLEAIAQAAGGVFVSARDHAEPLVALFERRIVSMARAAFEAEQRRELEERYQWPLLLALLLMLFERAVALRRKS